MCCMLFVTNDGMVLLWITPDHTRWMRPLNLVCNKVEAGLQVHMRVIIAHPPTPVQVRQFGKFGMSICQVTTWSCTSHRVRQSDLLIKKQHRNTSYAWLVVWNMFAPTRTLLRTYNRHDHHHHDHHHHHHNNHDLYLHEGSKFATPSEQYFDWGDNINYISMRDQNSPLPMNNMLIGVITPTISPWRIKIRHPLWTIFWVG